MNVLTTSAPTEKQDMGATTTPAKTENPDKDESATQTATEKRDIVATTPPATTVKQDMDESTTEKQDNDAPPPTTTTGNKDLDVSTAPATSKKQDMDATTTPATTEKQETDESTTQATSEIRDIDASTTQATSEIRDIDASTTQATSEIRDIDESTTQATSEIRDIDASIAPATTEKQGMDVLTTQVTTKKQDIAESTTQATTEKQDMNASTAPATTEKQDREESTRPATTEDQDIDASITQATNRNQNKEEPTTPGTTEKQDMEESTTPAPTEKQDMEESTTPGTTEKQDMEESTTPAPTENQDMEDLTTPGTTEKQDMDVLTTPAPTEKQDMEESTTPGTTEKQGMDVLTTQVTTEKQDIAESTAQATTEKQDMNASTAPATTEKQDREESTRPATTEDQDIDASITQATNRNQNKEEPTTPGTTEKQDMEESTTPAPTGKQDMEESTTPGTTGKQDMEESTTPGTTGKQDMEESTTPGTTGKQDMEDTTTPGTTENDDKDITTTQATNDDNIDDPIQILLSIGNIDKDAPTTQTSNGNNDKDAATTPVTNGNNDKETPTTHSSNGNNDKDAPTTQAPNGNNDKDAPTTQAPNGNNDKDAPTTQTSNGNNDKDAATTPVTNGNNDKETPTTQTSNGNNDKDAPTTQAPNGNNDKDAPTTQAPNGNNDKDAPTTQAPNGNNDKDAPTTQTSNGNNDKDAATTPVTNGNNDKETPTTHSSNGNNDKDAPTTQAPNGNNDKDAPTTQAPNGNNDKDAPTTQTSNGNNDKDAATTPVTNGNNDKETPTTQTSNGNNDKDAPTTQAPNGNNDKDAPTTQAPNGNNDKDAATTPVTNGNNDKETPTTHSSNGNNDKDTTQTPMSIGNNDQDAPATQVPSGNNTKVSQTTQAPKGNNDKAFIADTNDLPPKVTPESTTLEKPVATPTSSILFVPKDVGDRQTPVPKQSLDLILSPTNITSTTLAMLAGGQVVPWKASATTTQRNVPVVVAGEREGWEIPLLISLAVLVVLLLVFLVVFCLVCKRRLRRARAMRYGSHGPKYTGSAKTRAKPQPRDIWPASPNDSTVHLQMDSGFSDQWFESDFSNAAPFAFVNSLCREMSEEEIGVPAENGHQDDVEMSTFSVVGVDSEENVQDLHPDYYYEHIRSKKRLQEVEKNTRRTAGTQDRETGIYVNSDLSATDPVDKVTDVYSVVAPKKPKRKTASIGSKGEWSRQMSTPNNSERIPRTDFKRSQSDNDMGMHEVDRRSQEDYLPQNQNKVKNIGRYQTHANLEQIHYQDSFSHREDGVYANRDVLHFTREAGNGFTSGFGTSVTQILGRKPRLDKCVSFDEAERQRTDSSASGNTVSSEWPSFRNSTGNMDSPKMYSHGEFPGDIHKGISESPELRTHRDVPKDIAKDADKSSKYNSEPVSTTSTHTLDVPYHHSASDTAQGPNKNGSPSNLSASSSPNFPFLRKTTDRILANREISKRRQFPNLFDEETENFAPHSIDKTRQELNAKQMRPTQKSDRYADQPPNTHNFLSSNGGKKDASHLRGLRVPKITINNQNDSDDSSSNERDSKDTDIFTNVLKSFHKRDSYPSTTFIPPSGDFSEEAFAERLRRFSVPTMNERSPQLSNISPAFQRRIFKSMSSDGLGGDDVKWGSKYYGTLPENQRSWSDDFYDLIRRSDSNDPEKAEYFKKLINDRYEALFSNKYSDIRPEGFRSNVDGVYRRSGATGHTSPRTVKRRSAATRQKRLSRESSPIHSPYNSIDDGVSSRPTSPSVGGHGDPDHLKLPDPSEWKFLYDKVGPSNKTSTFDRDWEKRRPARRGLAEGTDGAESDKIPINITKNHQSLDFQSSPEDSGSFSLSSHKKSAGLDTDHLGEKNGLINSEMHIYSEIQGPKSEAKTNNSSCPNTPDSSDLSSDIEPNESSCGEPIYESIQSIDPKKPHDSDIATPSEVTQRGKRALEESGDDIAANNDYAEIGDLRKQRLLDNGKTSGNNNETKDTPKLPPLRQNQLPLVSKTGRGPSQLKHAQPRPFRPRSLTTSDTTSYKAFPPLTNSAKVNKYNRHRGMKMGMRDRNIFQNNPNSQRKQAPLKKARRFSRDADNFPEMTSQRNVLDGSQPKEPLTSRGRAYSVPTLSAGEMLIDLDLTQFKSSASNLILEHSDTDESMWFDEPTVLQDSQNSVEEALPSSPKKAQEPNGHLVNNIQRKAERVNYFGLNETVLAGLQKSSV